jgi:hypothetical protein
MKMERLYCITIIILFILHLQCEATPSLNVSNETSENGKWQTYAKEFTETVIDKVVSATRDIEEVRLRLKNGYDEIERIQKETSDEFNRIIADHIAALTALQYEIGLQDERDAIYLNANTLFNAMIRFLTGPKDGLSDLEK